MTDETSRVNVVFAHAWAGRADAPADRTISKVAVRRRSTHRNHEDAKALRTCSARYAFALMQILSGPREERIELVRVDQKINDERHRG